ERVIPPEYVCGIKALTGGQEASLFMGLLALVNALLYRYTSQEDIILGASLISRQHKNAAEGVRSHVKTFALRTKFKDVDSYQALLENIKVNVSGVYEHGAYSYDELIAALQFQRGPGGNALFDIQVVVQTADATRLRAKPGMGGHAGNGHETMVAGNVCNLEFHFEETEEALNARIIYNTDVYSEGFVWQLFTHLEELLAAIVASPLKPLRQLDYLSAVEERMLLVDFNGSILEYPVNRTALDIFEQQVLKNPDSTALTFEDVKLTYRELNEKSNRLANYLMEQYAVKANDLIGIMLDRSDKLIVGILGILKCGGAYVPIDPDYPAGRKNFILQDTGINLLLTQTEYIFNLDYYSGAIFAMDVQSDVIGDSIESPIVEINAADFAYVIY